MSQTETILLIVLGFSLASLIALFMGRMVWTAALKLGAKRMQQQVPSTLVELQAERTRLRAENAMMAQRLGRRLEEAKLMAAEQMAEVNRHRNRLRHLESSTGGGAAELQELRAQVKALETALAEAVTREHDLRRKLAAAEPTPAAPRRQQTAAAAKTRASQPQAAPQDDPELLLRQRIEKLAAMAKPGRRPPPPPEPQPADATDPAIAERLHEAEQRTAELEEQLRKLDAEWAANQDPPNQPSGKPAPDTVTDEANVIALSARIHNLRKSLGTQP